MLLERSTDCGSHCAQAVVADGQIVDSTPQDLLSFVSSNLPKNASSVIVINSPGGKVVASMELGQAFRKLGIPVIVATIEQSSGVSGGHWAPVNATQLASMLLWEDAARHSAPEQGGRPPHVPI